MSDHIPLFEIPWDIEDVTNVANSVGRGGYWAKGPYVEKFEKMVADYLDVEHAIAVNSGTSALMAALVGADIGDGDEVIVPSFTQQATANSVKMVGAEPVFADIEPNTYGLDPERVVEQITADTAAIMPVHVYGSVCEIEALSDLAEEHGILLIEDAAEALGAKKGGEFAGTIGDAAALSFCQNKIVPTGEGGMVITDSEDIAEGASLYHSHGRATENYFETSKSGEHIAIGGNFRMPDVVAALGCSQMEKIEDLIQGRRDSAARMNEAFEEMDGVEPHMFDGRHVYQFYTLTFDESIDRDGIIDVLAEHDISSKTYWDPVVHKSKVYDGQTRGQSLETTEEISKRVLSVPIHPELSSAESERIIDAIADGIKRFS